MSGTITANPNPIRVCKKKGLGATKVTWKAKGTTATEVRLDAPNGQVFSPAGPPGGTGKTGDWVGNDVTFYLQNVQDDAPRTIENTLARVTVPVIDTCK